MAAGGGQEDVPRRADFSAKRTEPLPQDLGDDASMGVGRKSKPPVIPPNVIEALGHEADQDLKSLSEMYGPLDEFQRNPPHK